MKNLKNLTSVQRAVLAVEKGTGGSVAGSVGERRKMLAVEYETNDYTISLVEILLKRRPECRKELRDGRITSHKLRELVYPADREERKKKINVSLPLLNVGRAAIEEMVAAARQKETHNYEEIIARLSRESGFTKEEVKKAATLCRNRPALFKRIERGTLTFSEAEKLCEVKRGKKRPVEPEFYVPSPEVALTPDFVPPRPAVSFRVVKSVPEEERNVVREMIINTIATPALNALHARYPFLTLREIAELYGVAAEQMIAAGYDRQPHIASTQP